MLKTILKKKIASSFDAWSKTYSRDVAPKLIKRGYHYAALAQLILSRFPSQSNAMMLEIGVGTGILGKEIFRLRPDLCLLGCDLSRSMLQHAYQSETYAMLLHCDAEARIPISENKIEYIYSTFMAHSVLNMRLFFHELKRVLMKYSFCILVDLFRTKKRFPLFSQFVDNIHSLRYEYGAFSNYHTIDEFCDTAKASGLDPVEVFALDADLNVAKTASGSMGHYLIKFLSI